MGDGGFWVDTPESTIATNVCKRSARLICFSYLVFWSAPMHRTAIVVAIVLTLSTMAFSGQGSQKSDGDNIRVVSVGEITKIDAETGSFELKSRVPEATSTGGRLGGWRGEVHVGISIGGGARRPETRGPTDPPWLPIPDALPRPARSARYTTTKVSTTEQTVFMQDGKKSPLTF